MNTPANAAIREKRRQSTPLDIEQMNIMKALTAAEYSRRQFVLNFAASKDTQLLIPGQKADAIKEAEEWAVSYLNQNGYAQVTNDFFKYTVDARLWTTWVGGETEFPFAFMRRGDDWLSVPSSTTQSSRQSQATDTKRPVSGIFPANYEIGVTRLDQVLTQTDSQPELPPARRPSKIEQREKSQPASPDQQPQQQAAPQRQRSSKKKQQSSQGTEEKRRSLSMYGFEDLKMTKKLNQDKFPLLVRLGRSFSRRMSG